VFPRYFTVPDGVTYRVLDTRMREGKVYWADPPAAWATARVFRPKTGWKRLYRFTSGASRATDDESLAAQFAVAEYLGAEKFDGSSHTPEPGRGAFSDPR
jgi:hypothetical protein